MRYTRTNVLLGLAAVVASPCWFYYQKPTRYTEPTRPIQHLGIIMDGNRRWAKRNGFKPWIGHKKGVDPVKMTLEYCLEHKIPHLTLYTFSLENFNRPQQELDYLFNILAKEISQKELQDIFERGIRVRFIGDRARFPAQLIDTINDIEEKTANNTALTLNLLFCYGGQQEIVVAAQRLARRCRDGEIDPQDITPQVFQEQLWLGDGPSPDLIIRTAGDQRLSNFLTWASAYSELAFLPCFWPDLTEKLLHETISNFYTRKRTFGT